MVSLVSIAGALSLAGGACLWHAWHRGSLGLLILGALFCGAGFGIGWLLILARVR